MAQFFKAQVLDADGYPLPEQPGPQQPGPGPVAGPADAEVAAARSELEEMLATIARLRPQVDALSAAAADTARQQGYNDGLARAQAEVKEQLVEAMSALTEAQRERQRIAEAHTEALRQLALQVARKVLGASFEADPALVTRVVEESLREIEPSYSLEVRVHPSSIEFVSGAREELERLVAGGGRIEVTADPTVDVGGCVLSTPVGEVDARISTKLAVLEAALSADRKQPH